MAASKKTVQTVVEILLGEIGHPVSRSLVTRLMKETVPSGNKSYDKTILAVAAELVKWSALPSEKNLYDVAKKVTLEAGMPYTDPRTGITTQPK